MAPPRVWLLSATQPEAFDLPALKVQLNQQRSDADVKQGRTLARQQQDRSLGAWLAKQDLAGRAERLGRLQHEAEELLADRVGTPLIERSLPALADDPSAPAGAHRRGDGRADGPLAAGEPGARGANAGAGGGPA